MFGPSRSLVLRALLLGIASGFRSQTPIAALALDYDDAPRSAGWRRWPVLRSSWGRWLLVGIAAGEIVVDKSPFAPSRLKPGPLVGRVMLGSLAGAALGTEGRGRAALARGAIAGAVGSLVGNHAGYHARRAAVDATGLPDPAVAVVEDAIAVTLATTAVQSR